MRIFQGHMNVQVCSLHDGGIKYLFKVFLLTLNGFQLLHCRNVFFHVRFNQIIHHLESHFASSSEAVWKIPQLHIQDSKPTYLRLEVQIEGHISVYFRNNGDSAAARQGTSLNGDKLFHGSQSFSLWQIAQVIYLEPTFFIKYNQRF